MKVDATYFIQCATGVNKIHTPGPKIMQTLGERPEISKINGVLLLIFYKNKLDYRYMQVKEVGTIRICFKLAMEE